MCVCIAVREDRMPGGRNSGAVYNLYKVNKSTTYYTLNYKFFFFIFLRFILYARMNNASMCTG